MARATKNIMNLIFTCVLLSCMSITRSEDIPHPDEVKKQSATEDQRVVNETISKYGPPQDVQKFGLPGPELLADKKKYLLNNTFTGDAAKYAMKIRTITRNFSYNARYEEGGVKEIEGKEVAVVKGQFAEHFERESGGYYIRTIGYSLDESGYKIFLVDLATATVNIRTRISSTVLASLVGGNALG